MEGEALAECGIWAPRWEDEMISLYRGTCCPPHQFPYPPCVAEPRDQEAVLRAFETADLH